MVELSVMGISFDSVAVLGMANIPEKNGEARLSTSLWTWNLTLSVESSVTSAPGSSSPMEDAASVCDDGDGETSVILVTCEG